MRFYRGHYARFAAAKRHERVAALHRGVAMLPGLFGGKR